MGNSMVKSTVIKICKVTSHTFVLFAQFTGFFFFHIPPQTPHAPHFLTRLPCLELGQATNWSIQESLLHPNPIEPKVRLKQSTQLKPRQRQIVKRQRSSPSFMQLSLSMQTGPMKTLLMLLPAHPSLQRYGHPSVTKTKPTPSQL